MASPQDRLADQGACYRDSMLYSGNATVSEERDSAMLWTQRLLAWMVSDLHAEMAERVAGRSRLAVWQRVVSRLGTLDAGEARGYIRARALAVIHNETDRLIEQEGSPVARIRVRIIAAASDSLVESLLVQFQQRRTGHVTRQAA